MITENSTTNIEDVEINSALNAILTTDKFSASPQMSAFLKYVVEQTLLGNTRRIKAFTVGIEALGKSPNFDPQTDPSVRVLAKRLRSSLDAYYEQNPTTSIFIEMKPGSYIPKFLLRSEMAATPEISASLTADYRAASYEGNAPTPPPSLDQTTHISVQQAERDTQNLPETEEAQANGEKPTWGGFRNTSKVA